MFGLERLIHRCRSPVLRTWLVVSLGMDLPPFARSWLQQRELGATALQAIEDAELRRLDPATALAQTEMLLSAVRLDDLSEERRTSSGFVEQQRLFARAGGAAERVSERRWRSAFAALRCRQCVRWSSW